MTDARLRDAERRWREGGRLEERLAWWSLRARSGELPPEGQALVMAVAEGRLDAGRVELAAYLGDPAAQALAMDEVTARVSAVAGSEGVLRVVAGRTDVRIDEVLAWIDALRLWDPAAVERALLEATRHVADHLGGLDLSRAEDEDHLLAAAREADRERGLSLAREALEAVERCLAGDAAPPTLGLSERGVHEHWPYVGPVVVAAATVARFVLARRAQPAGGADDALLAWRDTVRRGLPDPHALRGAVRDALVPWALRAP